MREDLKLWSRDVGQLLLESSIYNSNVLRTYYPVDTNDVLLTGKFH